MEQPYSHCPTVIDGTTLLTLSYYPSSNITTHSVLLSLRATIPRILILKTGKETDAKREQMGDGERRALTGRETDEDTQLKS